MRLPATKALAPSQDAVVLTRHAERLLPGAGRDGHHSQPEEVVRQRRFLGLLARASSRLLAP